VRNLQPMAHPRLADVATPTRKALLNTSLSNKPSPLLFRFQAAFGVSQRFRAAAACHQGKPCLASSNCRSRLPEIKRGNSDPLSARSAYATPTPAIHGAATAHSTTKGSLKQKIPFSGCLRSK
jgi:hypothetical protein